MMTMTTMQARINHPVMLLPDAMRGMMTLARAAQGQGLPEVTAKMVHLRASQINGCSVCVEMHARKLKELDESDRRIATVAAWREAPWFDDAERAALALAEALTRISDRPDPVPDEIWDDAARHYDEQALAALVVEIAAINTWNRLNVAVRQPAGAWVEEAAVAR